MDGSRRIKRDHYQEIALKNKQGTQPNPVPNNDVCQSEVFGSQGLFWLLFGPTKSDKFMPRAIYKVYVVELSKKVFTENTGFRLANPQFNGVLECLYVGMTSKTPAERFEQHKSGYINKKGHNLSAYLVHKYGRYLRPGLYNEINLIPMTKSEALMMEKKLAMDLRRQGYGVWVN